jgi:hypothetical protein
MNTYEDQTVMPVRTATANSGRMVRGKAIALEAAQTLPERPETLYWPMR